MTVIDEAVKMMVDYLTANSALLTALVLLMVLDYVTGTLGAIVLQKVSSSANSKGVAQKVLVILLLIAVAVVELAVSRIPSIPRLPYLQLAAIGFLAAEFISIVENVSEAGIIPKPLRPLFAFLSQRLAGSAQLPPTDNSDGD